MPSTNFIKVLKCHHKSIVLKQFPTITEDEWKARYHEQADMNKNLEKQIQMLQDKMRELKGEIEQSGNGF